MNIQSISGHAPVASSAAKKAAASIDTIRPTLDLQPDQSALVISKVELKAPEKVDLGYNSEEMRKSIQQAIENLNQQLKDNGRGLSFQMDETINRPIITVRNIHTGEVVRQIPNEEVVRMAHSIEEGKGLLFNEFL
ncbi:flagellar protein FlaG [Limnohabitans sp. Rim8]|uniref:flagellar protein FlaG n=1 Tax=Limnohabitans sp. Rim8 TaxID=1100718 RepID=UPI0026110E80|nr:flagellar protein FlaG [Limnohabitans sp. Rim8]